MLTSLLNTWRKNCKMEARDTLPEWVTMLSFVLILKACKIIQGITDNAKHDGNGDPGKNCYCLKIRPLCVYFFIINYYG